MSTVWPLKAFRGTVVPSNPGKEKSGFAGSSMRFNSVARESDENANTKDVARIAILNASPISPNCAPRNSGADG